MRFPGRDVVRLSCVTLPAMILISGCETAKTDPPVMQCPSWLERIITSPDDAMVDGTKRQITLLNQNIICECEGQERGFCD